MEKANVLLHQIQEIKSHQKQIPPKPKKQQQQYQQPQPQNWDPPAGAAPAPGPDLYNEFNNMHISGKNGHGRTGSGSSVGYPAGAAPPSTPGMPGTMQQQPPPPPKTSYDAPPYRPSLDMDPASAPLVSVGDV